MYRIWYKTTLSPPVKLLTHTEVISVFLVGWYHLWARAVPAIILSSLASDPVLRCSAQCHSSYRVTLCVGVSQGWLGKADRLALAAALTIRPICSTYKPWHTAVATAKVVSRTIRATTTHYLSRQLCFWPSVLQAKRMKHTSTTH